MTVDMADMIAYEEHLAAAGGDADTPVERFGFREDYPEWPLADFSWREEYPGLVERLADHGIEPEALAPPDHYVLEFGGDGAVRGLLARLQADPFDARRLQDSLDALRAAPADAVAAREVRAAYRYARRLRRARASTPPPHEARETTDDLGDYAAFLPDWRERYPDLADRDDLAHLTPPEVFILCAGDEETVAALVDRRESDPLVGGAIGAISTAAREANATPAPEELLEYAEHVREEQDDADPPWRYFGPEEGFDFYRERGLDGGALTPPEQFLALLGDKETTAGMLARHASDPFAGTALPDAFARILTLGADIEVTKMGEDTLAVDFKTHALPEVFANAEISRGASDEFIEMADRALPQVPFDEELEQEFRDHGPRLMSAIILRSDMLVTDYSLRIPPLLVENYTKQEIEGRLQASLEEQAFNVGAEARVVWHFDERVPAPSIAAMLTPWFAQSPASSVGEETQRSMQDLREAEGIPDIYSPHVEAFDIEEPVGDVLDMLEWLLGAVENTWGVSYEENGFTAEPDRDGVEEAE